MAHVIVEFLSEDIEMQELCQYYFAREERDGNWKWKHKVRDLITQFDLDKRVSEVSNLVAQHCRAHFPSHVCQDCEKPTHYMKSRSSWHSKSQVPKRCEQCQKQYRAQEKDSAKQKEEQEKNVAQDLAQKAFEAGVYESLNPIEFNLLVALAIAWRTTGGNLNQVLDAARKRLGLSRKVAKSICETFIELHLVRLSPEGPRMLRALQDALRQFGFRYKTKSIFGSPKALKLYRQLKREHLFVFPEIPMCAFIEQENIKHLFTEDWHPKYFLTARLDFVACDPDGKPRYAFEFQGGYHESREQQQKDAFKKLILAEVSLPLREVSSADLHEWEGS